MKELKFRAWDKNADCFTYSDQEDDNYEWGFEDGKLKAWAIVEMPGTIDEPPDIECVEFKEPEQYIGQSDDNDQEIYDGDYVVYENKDAEYKESHGIGLIQQDNHSHCVSGFSCRDIKTKHYVYLLCGHSLFSVQVISHVHIKSDGEIAIIKG